MVHKRISEIERRAAVINLSLAEACRAGSVHYSTLQRWRAGVMQPRASTAARVFVRLERALALHERRIVKSLEQRCAG